MYSNHLNRLDSACIKMYLEQYIVLTRLAFILFTDFFGAIRARVYDDEVRKWAVEVGVENIRKKLINSIEGPPTFEQPKMTLSKLMQYGNMLVQEQENVKRVQLADKYLNEAALGDANEDTIRMGKF